MAAPVKRERVFYLLDPIGAGRRSLMLRAGDFFLRAGKKWWVRDDAFELPWTPAFLHKHGGLVLSIGQFNQWVGSKLMAGGLAQIWPGMPVSGPIFDGNNGKEKRTVLGLRLADQGVDKHGVPAGGYHAGHGRARTADGCGRWSGGRGGAEAR